MIDLLICKVQVGHDISTVLKKGPGIVGSAFRYDVGKVRAEIPAKSINLMAGYAIVFLPDQFAGLNLTIRIWVGLR